MGEERVDRPSGSESIGVYVLDDHDFVVRTLGEFIDSVPGMRVVGASTIPSTALAEIVALRPDVAVIDAHLGDVDGLTVCRRLRTAAPGVACVIVTAGVRAMWSSRDLALAGSPTVVVKQLIHFPLAEAIENAAGGPV